MVKKAYYIYGIYSIVALLIGILKNYSLKVLTVMGQSINIDLWMLSSLVLLTSGVSLIAVHKLDGCKTVLKEEAIKVGVESRMLIKNNRLIKSVSKNLLFYVGLFISSVFAGMIIPHLT